jgi:hypothetical protein
MIKKLLLKLKTLIRSRSKKQLVLSNVSEYLTRHITQHQISQFKKDYVRLQLIGGTNKEIKLHFGCGPRILKGWINIDLSYEPFEPYLSEDTKEIYLKSELGDRNDLFTINVIQMGLPLPNDSVNVVFHEDFIEHLDQRSQIIFLAEIRRVLKKGGIHRVNTPNLTESMKNSDFEYGKEGIYIEEWDQHGHKNVLSTKALEELALMVGYEKIIFSKRNGSLGSIPNEYRPGNDRPEEGNIFADLIK